METRAVNLRQAPYDVYIGRAGRGQDGYFGNPVARGKKCPQCGGIHSTGGSTLKCYKQYFRARLALDGEFKRRIETLQGKTLGCFCKPAACHGDVIAEYLNSL